MKKYFLIGFPIIFAIVLVNSCSSIKTYMSGSDTNLKSSSLITTNSLRANGITISGSKEGSNWCITPAKISGKVMSVVIPSTSGEDEGITPFGSGRPDIAPANSVLYDFDLSNTTNLHSDSISLKPGFVGGKAEQIILLFGYFDVEFLQGIKNKKIRFVYGDTDPYVRGDKLLYNPTEESTGKYYWYDKTSGAFVSESLSRPSNPSLNTYVSTFSDPVRPNLHYYMLGAQLRNCTDYDNSTKDYITLGKSILEECDLSFTVDFDVRNAVVFNNVSSEAAFNALTDEELIQKFDMKQNVSSWGNSGLYCSIVFTSKPKYK